MGIVNGFRFLILLGMLAMTNSVLGDDSRQSFLHEAQAIRQRDNKVEVDISDLAVKYFPLGEDQVTARERLRNAGLQVWKRDSYSGKKFIGASHKHAIGPLHYDEYRVWIDLDEQGKTTGVRARIYFHSL